MNKTLAVAFVMILLAALLAPLQAEPVFPGAVGFGTQTKAGSGGQIIRVTTLKANGPGSLREALGAKGPRIVVFEVDGVIDLGKKVITISEPFLTIAGQTAPAPGITLIRGGLQIKTHDILIQHLSVRPGDAGMPKKSGWSPDGIGTSGGEAYNVVIDHCSCTWAIDENLSASSQIPKGRAGASHDVTFSNCIIAEGLNNSSHEKGPHSKGSLIHDFCHNISIIGNLYAHNVQRNPLYKGNVTSAFVNNVIYNPKDFAIRAQYVPEEYAKGPTKPDVTRISVVGNVFHYGPNTKKGMELVSGTKPHGEVYAEDNIAKDREGKDVPAVAKVYKILNEKPCWPDGLKARPAAEVEASVLKNAGARPAERDAIDQRIVDTVKNGDGKVIDSQDEVGGYPKVEETRRKLEVPEKDVEAWLAKMAAAVEGK